MSELWTYLETVSIHPGNAATHIVSVSGWIILFLNVFPGCFRSINMQALRAMIPQPMLLLAIALVGGLSLLGAEPLEKPTIPIEHFSDLEQLPLHGPETPVVPQSYTVEDAQKEGKLQPVRVTMDSKSGSASLSNPSVMAGDNARSKPANGIKSSGAVESAGFEPLTSKQASRQGKLELVEREQVAMSTLPSQAANPNHLSGSNSWPQPKTSKRAAGVLRAADGASTRRLLTFETSSDLVQHFTVESCAGRPMGSIPDPMDPTCYFICLGVDDRGLRKCCLFGSCYVPPGDPLVLGHCSDCSSDPANRQTPPPTATLYALVHVTCAQG
jgi:hypothetical protein